MNSDQISAEALGPGPAPVQPLGPGDVAGLYNCLQGALSHGPSRQQAEDALRSLEARPGFCSCLVEIVGSREADHSARWLAAVHLKNTVTRRWRGRGAGGALPEAERAHLRGRLLGLLPQEEQQVAVQVAVVLARVARHDYPRAWPGLLAELLAALGPPGGAPPPPPAPGGDDRAAALAALSARRAHLAMHHVLKELASKRLAADQRAFEAAAGQLLRPLWERWAADSAALAAALPAALAAASAPPPPAAPPSGQAHAQQALLLVFERWLLLLKCLRRLLVFGAPPDARSMEPVPAVAEAMPPLLASLRALAALRPPPPGPGAPARPRPQLAAMLDRGVLKLAKTLRQLAATHPWTALHCGALVPALEWAVGAALAARGAEPFAAAAGEPPPSPADAALVRTCLGLAADVLGCPSYRGSPAQLVLSASARGQVGRVKELAQGAAPALDAFWGGGRAEALAEALVARHLPLSGRDLAAWAGDAEAFHHECEAGDAGDETSPRGAAEACLLALVRARRGAAAPVLLRLLAEAEAGCPAAGGAAAAAAAGAPAVRGVPAAALRKEAAYAAAHVAAYELAEEVDFPRWLHGGGLLAEMADAAPAAAPLRRRALRLGGAWAPRLRREDRPPVYAATIAALRAPDAAVALAAAAALHALVDDWEFDADAFGSAGLAAAAFEGLAGLLAACREFDSHVAAFGVVNLLVDRLGEGVRPHAGGLLALLPAAWAAGEGQPLLRIQVLCCLQRLVHALGPASPAAHAAALPLLAAAADPAGADAGTLLEDGLHLWLVLLRNAPAPAPPGLLDEPFPLLLAGLAASTEHVAVAMRVAASAVLLGGDAFLGRHGAALAACLDGLLGSTNDRGALALLPAADAVLKVAPDARGVGLLAAPLGRLAGQLVAGRAGVGMSGLVAGPALCTLARAALADGAAFLAALAAAAPGVALPPGAGLLAPPPRDDGAAPAAAAAAAAAPAAAGVAPADPAARLLLALLDAFVERFDCVGTAAGRKLCALALAALLAAPVPGALARLDGVAAHVTGVWCELEDAAGGGRRAGDDGVAFGLDYYAAAAPRDDDLAGAAAVNSEEAEAETERRRAAWAADPAATRRLAPWLSAQLGAAAAAHGAPAVHAALGGLDPALGAAVRRMLDDAGAAG